LLILLLLLFFVFARANRGSGNTANSPSDERAGSTVTVTGNKGTDAGTDAGSDGSRLLRRIASDEG